MKPRGTIAIVALTAFLAGTAGAQTPLFVDSTPSDNFKLYWLVKTDKPPTIDGTLDEPIWQQADPLQGWGTTDYGRQREKLGDIDFRACWDDTYLYIGARMYHRRDPKDMDELRRQVADVSKSIYSRECLEIHIDGKHDHATRFQSIVNPLGEKMMIWYYDFGWGILNNVDYGLDADWDSAARIEKDCWTVEVRYALADIQVQPKIGYMFGINPCWFNWADSRADLGPKRSYWWQFTTWSTHGAGHDNARLYGHFMLVDKKPEDMEKGLRLAYPDLDKRTVMIQTDRGYMVFRNGKKEEQSYDVRLRTEAQSARTAWQKLADLHAGRKIAPGPNVKQMMAKNDEALKTIEQALAGTQRLGPAEVGAHRQVLAGLSDELNDAFWRAKLDVLAEDVASQK